MWEWVSVISRALMGNCKGEGQTGGHQFLSWLVVRETGIVDEGSVVFCCSFFFHFGPSPLNLGGEEVVCRNKLTWFFSCLTGIHVFLIICHLVNVSPLRRAHHTKDHTTILHFVHGLHCFPTKPTNLLPSPTFSYSLAYFLGQAVRWLPPFLSTES